MWSKLKSMFDDSGFTRKISLLRALFSTRLENCKSMALYVNQVIETVQRLRGTGFNIDDKWIGLLFAGLSEKFSPMIMVIEHSGIVITADSIKAKLLDMESDVGKVGTAFVSKVASNKKPKVNYEQAETAQSDNKKEIHCYKCKQTRHYKSRCPNAKTTSNTNDNKRVLMYLMQYF